MSTALSLPRTDDALAYLQAEIAACWNNVFDAAFGSAAVHPEALDTSADSENCVWFHYDFTPPALAGIAFELERTTAVALGHRVLSAKGRASEHEHHAIHATHHLITQLAACLAASFSSRLNTNVTSAESPDEGPSSSPHSFTVAFPGGSSGKASLTVCPSQELIDGLGNPDSRSAVCDASASHARSRNLDLLLDVEMPVSVSFGTTRLQLKDVAKLTAGSVVELNRTLSDPIEIIVNNCSIARGEVVIVDGNFGVRIKEIMSKHDRLRSLT
jgi:flagellar motor switch protein FliN